MPKSKSVEIDWDDPTKVEAHYATHLAVSHTPDEFIVTFFSIFPPLLIGSNEAKEKKAESIDAVRAKALTRVVVTPQRMREIVQVLQDNLKRYEADHGTGAEKTAHSAEEA